METKILQNNLKPSQQSLRQLVRLIRGHKSSNACLGSLQQLWKHDPSRIITTRAVIISGSLFLCLPAYSYPKDKQLVGRELEKLDMKGIRCAITLRKISSVFAEDKNSTSSKLDFIYVLKVTRSIKLRTNKRKFTCPKKMMALKIRSPLQQDDS